MRGTEIEIVPEKAVAPFIAVACALVVVVAAVVFRENMGTHRPAIHVVAILSAVVYVLALRSSRKPWQLLGLQRPHGGTWLWVLLAAGALSGVMRYEFYRATGFGGLRLYEQEFVPLLIRGSLVKSLAAGAVFLCGLYVAVLVPAVLFFAVIQEPFSRAGLFPVGLLMQSAVFGLVHCYMAGSFSMIYGAEALSGAIVSGLAYEYLKNAYVAAVFMSASVFTATLLLFLRPA